MVNGLIKIPESSNAYFTSFTGGFFYFGKTMLSFLLKIWTALELLLFLKKQRENQKEEQCNSSTQEPQQNLSDTP